MQNLEFTPEEHEILEEVLRHQMQELEIEVARTATHDFKEKLKHRRQVLLALTAKLAARPVAS